MDLYGIETYWNHPQIVGSPPELPYSWSEQITLSRNKQWHRFIQHPIMWGSNLGEWIRDFSFRCLTMFQQTLYFGFTDATCNNTWISSHVVGWGRWKLQPWSSFARLKLQYLRYPAVFNHGKLENPPSMEVFMENSSIHGGIVHDCPSHRLLKEFSKPCLITGSRKLSPIFGPTHFDLTLSPTLSHRHRRGTLERGRR